MSLVLKCEFGVGFSVVHKCTTAIHGSMNPSQKGTCRSVPPVCTVGRSCRKEKQIKLVFGISYNESSDSSMN